MSTPIHTSFTKLLGIKTPIVAASMAGASGGSLAAQVSLAGGFGFLSAGIKFLTAASHLGHLMSEKKTLKGYDSVENLEKEIAIARNALHLDEKALLPVGVGFLCWQLEKTPEKAEQLLTATLKSHVQAIWFAFGADIAHWVDYVRTHDPHAGTEGAVKLFVQVSTVAETRSAITNWKADVIIAQGNEAGGHGLNASLPLLTLFPLLLKVVAELDGPPLLAAGGIATGSQIASLLTLGASGVVLGTRFLLCPESLYTQSQRTALLNADSSQSVRTMAFDHARNTLGWPKGVDGRGLRNATVDDYERGEDIEEIRRKFKDGLRVDDSNRTVVWAGSSVGLMSQIMSAKDTVNELHEECLEHLQKVTKLVSNQ